MRKKVNPIAGCVFTLIFLPVLLISTFYHGSFRDFLFPSTPENVYIKTISDENELLIYFKWAGFKEYYSGTDFLVIRFNKQTTEFLYEGIDGSEDFYKVIRYLQGNYTKPSSSNLEAELVIPIEPSAKEGEISISKVKKDLAADEQIVIYYVHVIDAPMDMLTGWIKLIDWP